MLIPTILTISKSSNSHSVLFFSSVIDNLDSISVLQSSEGLLLFSGIVDKIIPNKQVKMVYVKLYVLLRQNTGLFEVRLVEDPLPGHVLVVNFLVNPDTVDVSHADESTKKNEGRFKFYMR